MFQMDINCEYFSKYPQPFLFLRAHPAASCGLSFCCWGMKATWKLQEQIVSAFSKGRLCQSWGIQHHVSCVTAHLDRQVPPAASLVPHTSFGGYSKTQEKNLQVFLLMKLKCYLFRISANHQKVVSSCQGQRIKIILNNF